MVKGSRRWAKTTWPMERLHGLHDDIFTRLMEGDGGIPWSTQAWLGEWSDELGDLSDLRYDWVDPGTDDTPNTSLTNARCLSSHCHKAAAPAWFSISNPELQSLMISALAGSLQASEARSATNKTPSNRDPARSSFDRKITSDVTQDIPTQDGKEVCLHFLSKRGCKSQDPN
ncbi:hypothetical protein PC119_g22222 [Phytophthora cactorum]|nr:hypothetical protein PC119_g22222 [Phytophthora cactorum]KAG3132150.1 hypothetical protein C6341_g23049 [Phytophthora cactorum]